MIALLVVVTIFMLHMKMHGNHKQRNATTTGLAGAASGAGLAATIGGAAVEGAALGELAGPPGIVLGALLGFGIGLGSHLLGDH